MLSIFFAYKIKKFGSLFRRGFGIVEIVVGAAIISLALLGAAAAMQVALRVSEDSLYRVQNSFLLEEGIEALRAMRDGGWSANIATLSPDMNYYLAFDGAIWRATTSNTYIAGMFERRFTVNNVYRNANDDIADSGTLDPNTKKISVFVSWKPRGSTTTESISTYLTNIFNN